MTRAALVLALLSCNGSTPPKQNPSDQPPPHKGTDLVNCDDALRMIRARDFRTWQGLPEDCTPERLAKGLPRSSPTEGMRQLGADAIDVVWWPAEVAGYREPLEVQLAQSIVVRIDGIGPELAEGVPAQLAALGTPAGKLPYWDATKRIADGEWVWPARGIAIYVGSDPRFVRRVALFRPTDLATYERLLQPSLRSYE
jgi:hypothetical protein